MPSSVISHFSYDMDSSTLKITFVSGKIYKYNDVPQEVYDEMKANGSKGRYFNYFIKDRYKFKKIKSS